MPFTPPSAFFNTLQQQQTQMQALNAFVSNLIQMRLQQMSEDRADARQQALFGQQVQLAKLKDAREASKQKQEFDIFKMGVEAEEAQEVKANAELDRLLAEGAEKEEPEAQAAAEKRAASPGLMGRLKGMGFRAGKGVADLERTAKMLLQEPPIQNLIIEQLTNPPAPGLPGPMDWLKEMGFRAGKGVADLGPMDRLKDLGLTTGFDIGRDIDIERGVNSEAARAIQSITDTLNAGDDMQRAIEALLSNQGLEAGKGVFDLDRTAQRLIQEPTVQDLIIKQLTGAARAFPRPTGGARGPGPRPGGGKF